MFKGAALSREKNQSWHKIGTLRKHQSTPRAFGIFWYLKNILF
jgi:hypothetical protein